MTQRDLEEVLFHGLTNDAQIIGCAPADMLAPHLPALLAVQDEIARAVEKARAYVERKAA